MFADQLLLRIARGLAECHTDNYDAARFGRPPFGKDLRDRVRQKFGVFGTRRLWNRIHGLEPHLEGLERTWQRLNDDASRALLVDLVAYRILGHRHIRLPTHTQAYRDRLQKLESSAPAITDRIQTGFKGLALLRRDMKEFGLNFEAYVSDGGIMAEFHCEQYAYRQTHPPIQVDPGDIVIDAGGCWGEASLYFAELAGPDGHVYTFEFVPSNLEIFRRNLDLNPELKKRIEIVENPVWSDNQGQLHYRDRGPASSVSPEPFEGADGSVRLQSIDALVAEKAISKISFIKMDIEGAEQAALKGARETLKRFRPKLAISVYHDLADFHEIPDFLASLDLGYRFYLKHATINSEETVLFAAPER